ncbi:hypothetical protein [Chroogloeocystis siderophila]|uniref:hypothetical protein n=2 Tax=Chroogloeocystis siderophila TaxID=329163 RepID=UPI0015B90877|nr:hypothetical protein [Chroogloeocystis siderophila]
MQANTMLMREFLWTKPRVAIARERYASRNHYSNGLLTSSAASRKQLYLSRLPNELYR